MNWKRGCKRVAGSLSGIWAIFCFWGGYIHPYGKDTITIRLLTAFISAVTGYCFFYIISSWICKYIRWLVLGFCDEQPKNEKSEMPKNEQK